MAKSKKRLEMGEEAWTEYQKERNRRKSRSYYSDKGKYTTCWRIRIKNKLIAYKGGKCERCGYNKPVPNAYDFHHKDPALKDFGIGSYKVLKFERLKEEADKCEMLCRNCHAEVHHELNKKKQQKLLDAHDAWLQSRLESQTCPHCGKDFQPYRRQQKACKTCAPLSNKKVLEPPTKTYLIKMMKNMTWRAIGQKYGVSDTAVKKWAKRMKISWKPHARRNKC